MGKGTSRVGFKWEDGVSVPDEREQALLARLEGLAAVSTNVSEIARTLKAEGYVSRAGTPISREVVYDLWVRRQHPEGAVHFEGRPCRACATTLKYVRGAKCVRCHVARMDQRQKENPDAARKKNTTINARKCRNRREHRKHGKGFAMHGPVPEMPVRCENPFCRMNGEYGRLGLAIDHDRNKERNNFRAWLCMSCNTGSGHFGDNPEALLWIAANILLKRGNMQAVDSIIAVWGAGGIAQIK